MPFYLWGLMSPMHRGQCIHHYSVRQNCPAGPLCSTWSSLHLCWLKPLVCGHSLGSTGPSCTTSSPPGRHCQTEGCNPAQCGHRPLPPRWQEAPSSCSFAGPPTGTLTLSFQNPLSAFRWLPGGCPSAEASRSWGPLLCATAP